MRNSPSRASLLFLDRYIAPQNIRPPLQPQLCLRCSRRLLNTSPTFEPSSIRHHAPRRRTQSTWTTAVNAAQSMFANGQKHIPKPPSSSFNTDPLPGGVKVDPLRTVAKEMKFLTNNIQQLLGSGHPMLDTVAKYYTQSEGKHIRPMLVLLVSQATALIPAKTRPNPSHSCTTTTAIPDIDIDAPITPASILSDHNPSPSTPAQHPPADSNILPSQARLAEITELIHIASLLHDDVLDHASTRRAAPSANTRFGNKMAVLAGDFLLGRASVALARLRDPEVTELLATVIANLIEGEFMQLRNTEAGEETPSFDDDRTLAWYLRKTYLKSASLMSKSCRAAALLGGHAGPVADAAYSYGKNMGLAFQLVDDMLDYTAPGALGKPAGADLELGLATAPLLFAWKQHPRLGELVGRRFKEGGDVERARDMVRRSDGVEQTRALAGVFAERAGEAVSGWPEGEARSGLVGMCGRVMAREK